MYLLHDEPENHVSTAWWGTQKPCIYPHDGPKNHISKSTRYVYTANLVLIPILSSPPPRNSPNLTNPVGGSMQARAVARLRAWWAFFKIKNRNCEISAATNRTNDRSLQEGFLRGRPAFIGSRLPYHRVLVLMTFYIRMYDPKKLPKSLKVKGDDE